MVTTQTKRGNGRAPSKRGNDGRFVAKYSRRLGVEICRRVASGKSLSEVCRDQHMPHRDTVQTWLANPKYDELRREYDRAIQLRADRIFDELLQIADDARNDWMERQRQDGSTEIKFDKENVQRSRLRIDTRKWVLGRMNPQKYGDRVTSHITADPPPGSREGDSPRERVLKKLADMRRRSDQVSLGFAAAGDLGLPESIANDRRCGANSTRPGLPRPRLLKRLPANSLERRPSSKVPWWPTRMISDRSVSMALLISVKFLPGSLFSPR